jgi:NADPH-dependent 2,4-dienoyl-CoA reductase/sulfur reductase-like enzyme
MQQTIQIRLKPEEAANAPLLVQAIAQSTGQEVSHINGYHILKQSIDARSRQQVWLNLTIQAFINEAPSKRFIEPIHYPSLSPNAKEVLIIGAGPAGLFAALECIQQGLKPIILERGKEGT